jgi:hypothetical protein
MDASGRLWPRPELRVGDVDRQSAGAELQRHFVDGRLTSDELDERVSQTLKARTFGELAIPLADLPVLASPSQIQPQPADQGYRTRGSNFGPALGALMIAIGVLAMVWMFVLPGTHLGGMPFWPIFILGFFFIGRTRRGGRRDRWHRGGPPTRYL